jgi:hypothetical protein
MCLFYDNEDQRADVFRRFWENYGIKLAAAVIDGTSCRTNGHIDVGGKPTLITEVKNEKGAAPTEPSFQSIIYFTLFAYEYDWWQTPNNFPCFIVTIAGQFCLILLGIAIT